MLALSHGKLSLHVFAICRFFSKLALQSFEFLRISNFTHVFYHL